MDGGSSEGSDARFVAYVEALGMVLGHADRHQPMHDYCLGLLMPIERKSVEPMAAVTAPAQVAAKHQSLLHFVGNAPWSDAAMLAKVGELVLPAIERSGAIEAWIIDDTGFPKKGRHSVGVTRQYCGQLGKQDNCQVAVSLSLANHDASLPIAYRLYLPEDWAKDQARRDKAKVPETIAFQTKPEIALEQIKAARTAGLPQGVVLMDAGYGNDTGLRTDITSLGLRYVAGIGPNTSVWPPGEAPLPPQSRTGRGRPQTRLQRGQHQPISVKTLALSLPQEAWQTITWREGTTDRLASRFARRRVRPAHRDNLLSEFRAEEWLLIEWPEDETEPTKYWFSTLPEETAFDRLVDLTKLRWRIERDYQELKQELGLGDYEGRGWRGFHHHATLCIAAYGFLIAERGAIPPSGPGFSAPLTGSAVPEGYRPRGAADPTRTTHPQLDRNNPTAPHRRARQDPSEMPLLQYAHPEDGKNSRLLTQ
jgi:SRSO17 transposase